MEENNQLRILFVEDMPSDMELAERELTKNGISFVSIRVETRDEFIKNLDSFKPDLVISDYSLPSFDGMQALKLLLEHDGTIPFIVFTGSMNEETAVACMKAGATDYIIKEYTKRLPFAVREALLKKKMSLSRDRAEKELAQKKEELNNYFDNALDLFCIVSTDGLFVRLNKAWERVLGLRVEELEGKTILDFVHPDDLRTTADVFSLLQNGKEISGFVNRFRCIDGSYRWIEWKSSPKDNLIYAAARDITDRKQAEDALKESEERLQLAMEVSEHGFWDWDMDSNKAYFSPKWYTILGYEPNELAMNFGTWSGLLHPDERDIVLESLMAHLRALQYFKMDYRMRSKSGEWVWVTGRGRSFKVDGNGVPHRAVGTYVDITRRKKAEEQMLLARIAAEEANRSKSEFLGNMSHELRTPLSGVIGFSDILLEELSAGMNETQIKYISTINRSGNQLLHIINKILEISCIDSGSMCIRLDRLSIHSAVEHTYTSLNSLAVRKRIELRTDIDSRLTEITADVEKFKSILYNLVENSIKFTPEGGIVTIRAIPEVNHIKISVSDTGIGIPDQEKGRIFEPFFQVDSSASRSYGGTGLGLMLVKEYVKMHEGTIWVESEPGKGSTFTFIIPIGTPPSESPE
ncbi:MAG: PAS domain-containing protein [Methanolobus sp.]|uniref:PAS domain-containing protein n=1 Tax=Methanolobus sp. TaxID=1874737 RepID=UPI0027321912|nr:PAS domain-containing protein [Methanolobus sp.]MDP2217506.1 PAS domain-containing protein [Methanolobus sp.]